MVAVQAFVVAVIEGAGCDDLKDIHRKAESLGRWEMALQVKDRV